MTVTPPKGQFHFRRTKLGQSPSRRRGPPDGWPRCRPTIRRFGVVGLPAGQADSPAAAWATPPAGWPNMPWRPCSGRPGTIAGRGGPRNGGLGPARGRRGDPADLAAQLAAENQADRDQPSSAVCSTTPRIGFLPSPYRIPNSEFRICAARLPGPGSPGRRCSRRDVEAAPPRRRGRRLGGPTRRPGRLAALLDRPDGAPGRLGKPLSGDARSRKTRRPGRIRRRRRPRNQQPPDGHRRPAHSSSSKRRTIRAPAGPGADQRPGDAGLRDDRRPAAVCPPPAARVAAPGPGRAGRRADCRAGAAGGPAGDLASPRRRRQADLGRGRPDATGRGLAGVVPECAGVARRAGPHSHRAGPPGRAAWRFASATTGPASRPSSAGTSSIPSIRRGRPGGAWAWGCRSAGGSSPIRAAASRWRISPPAGARFLITLPRPPATGEPPS